MTDPGIAVTTCCGRPITREEFVQIKETVALFSNLSRKELIHTICEHLDWRTASGTNKWDACASLLRDFEKEGHIRLPAKNFQHHPPQPPIRHSGATDPSPALTLSLKALLPITLDPATTPSQVRLWNEYMDRYHYLGYKKPFGYHLRYFIKSPQGLLGCLLFSGAARAIAPRDRWIGWTQSQRTANLPWVINNSRFLIFPWVNVKNLASHVLGLARRRISMDWENRWHFSPILMETFVDPERYRGTCYLAANWILLGTTTGRGLIRKGRTYSTQPKKIFVLPVDKRFRQLLCAPPASHTSTKSIHLKTKKRKKAARSC